MLLRSLVITVAAVHTGGAVRVVGSGGGGAAWLGTHARARAPDVVAAAPTAAPPAAATAAATTFEDLLLRPECIEALAALGVHEPNALQARAMGEVLGRSNLLLGAQTGSGKTLTYLAPVMQSIKADEEAGSARAKPRRPRAVVLVPTRELALQVYDVAKALSHHLKLSVAEVHGGVPDAPQLKRLQHPTDVLVATPGRLVKLMERQGLYLGDVRHMVLDEVDTMFDAGFGPELDRILAITTRDLSADPRCARARLECPRRPRRRPLAALRAATLSPPSAPPPSRRPPTPPASCPPPACAGPSSHHHPHPIARPLWVLVDAPPTEPRRAGPASCSTSPWGRRTRRGRGSSIASGSKAPASSWWRCAAAAAAAAGRRRRARVGPPPPRGRPGTRSIGRAGPRPDSRMRGCPAGRPGGCTFCTAARLRCAHTRTHGEMTSNSSVQRGLMAVR